MSALANNQAFEDCDLDTNFIERYRDELILEDAPSDEDALVAATVYQLVQRQQAAEEAAANSADPYSPWNSVSGWRLNTDNHHAFEYIDYVDSIPNEVSVTTHYRDVTHDHLYLLELPSKEIKIHAAELNDNNLRLDAAGKRFNARVVDDGKSLHIFVNGNYQMLEKVERGLDGDSEDAGGSLTAPMPGTVIEVKVAEGDSVEAGQPLIILEAMKMEHTINAPTAGTVAEVLYNAGDLVNDGAELLILDATD